MTKKKIFQVRKRYRGETFLVASGRELIVFLAEVKVFYTACAPIVSAEGEKMCFAVESYNRNISRTRGEKAVTTQFSRLHSLCDGKQKPNSQR